MKVLLVSSTLPPYKCGVGDYTDKLSEQLNIQGVDVSVLTTTGFRKTKNYDVLPLINNWNDVKTLLIIIKTCLTEKYDVVHVQMPTALYGKGIIISFVIPFLRILGIKTVLTLHEYSFSTFGYRIKLLPSILLTNKIIVVEPFYKTDISGKIKFVNKKKFNYINIGSNIKKTETSQETIDRNRLRIDPSKEKMLVGAFGFVSEVKCYEIVLKSIKVLKDTGLWKSKFVIISDVSKNNVYQEKILNMIDEYELADDIYITGFLESSDVADMLSSMDCACMLFRDGVSVRNGSFLAAMAQGLLVITSKPHFDFDYGSSCLFVDNEVDSLKDAILKIQERYLSGLKVKIDNHIYKNLSWESIAQRHYKLYEELT